MLYGSSAMRLAACATSRLSPRSTLLSGSQSARCICTNAFASFGLRCIVSTLFGTKPSVFKKESNSSFMSGVVSGGSGSSRGDFIRDPRGASQHILQEQKQPADHRDIGEEAVLHAASLHRIFHLPETQQQERRKDSEDDEAEHADRRMPVGEDQRAADELEEQAGPECLARHRAFENAEPLDVILDVMRRQVADADDEEERHDQQPPGGVVDRSIVRIEPVHCRFPYA